MPSVVGFMLTTLGLFAASRALEIMSLSGPKLRRELDRWRWIQFRKFYLLIFVACSCLFFIYLFNLVSNTSDIYRNLVLLMSLCFFIFIVCVSTVIFRPALILSGFCIIRRMSHSESGTRRTPNPEHVAHFPGRHRTA